MEVSVSCFFCSSSFDYFVLLLFNNPKILPASLSAECLGITFVFNLPFPHRSRPEGKIIWRILTSLSLDSLKLGCKISAVLILARTLLSWAWIGLEENTIFFSKSSCRAVICVCPAVWSEGKTSGKTTTHSLNEN